MKNIIYVFDEDLSRIRINANHFRTDILEY